MAEDGRIVYKVTCDTSDVEKDVSEGGRRAGSAFENVMIGAARRVGEAFVEMAAKAVDGVKQIVQAGVEFNAKMETYQTAFTTLLGSAEEAQRVMAQIRQDAASTPFDVDSLTQANQMLISAGVSADQARKDVLNLANAIAATGGGSAELSRMAANMQQIQNVGKATAMDIRQFANAGINIYGLLADAMGVTTAQAAEMDVSYEMLAYALEKAAASGGMYEDALIKQSQTFEGRMSTLKDNVTQLEGALTEDIFNTLSNTFMPRVMEWVSQLLEAAQTNGVQGAMQVAGEICSDILEIIFEWSPDIAESAVSMMQGFVNGLEKFLPKILDVGIEAILDLVNGLVKGLPRLISKGMELVQSLAKTLIDRAPEIVQSGVTLLNSLLDGIVENLPKLISTAGDLIIAFGKAIIQNLPQILEAGAKLLLAIVEGVYGRLAEIGRVAMELCSEFFNTIKNVNWWDVGAGIVKGIGEGFTAWWNDLVSQVGDAMKSLYTSVKNFFGIHSPSTKFAWIAEMNVKGMEKGFEDEEASLTRTVHDVFDTVPETAMEAARYNTADFEKNVSYNVTASGTVGGQQIVVPLFLDGREIARATAWSMGQQLAWQEM